MYKKQPCSFNWRYVKAKWVGYGCLRSRVFLKLVANGMLILGMPHSKDVMVAWQKPLVDLNFPGRGKKEAGHFKTDTPVPFCRRKLLLDDMPSRYTKFFLVVLYYTNKLRYQEKTYQYSETRTCLYFLKSDHSSSSVLNWMDIFGMLKVETRWLPCHQKSISHLPPMFCTICWHNLKLKETGFSSPNLKNNFIASDNSVTHVWHKMLK